MIEAGLVSAIGLIIVLCRFNFRRICGYATIVDVLATSAFVWMFIGTYAGMMTGLFAGVLVSLTLNAARKLYGYDRAHLRRMAGNLMPSLVWIHTPGRLS
jgi:hypothetical protein